MNEIHKVIDNIKNNNIPNTKLNKLCFGIKNSKYNQCFYKKEIVFVIVKEVSPKKQTKL